MHQKERRLNINLNLAGFNRLWDYINDWDKPKSAWMLFRVYIRYLII